LGTPPKIVLLQADAEAPSVYSGALTKADIAKWVEKTAAPAIVTLDQNPKNRKALQKVFSSPKPKLLGFIDKGHKSAKAFKDALIESSKDHEDVAFIFADNSGNDGALTYFGITAKDTPAFVIHDQEGGDAKYVLKSAEPSALAAWVKDFAAGKLEKAVKSEEPPADNDGPVTILTAKTFNDIVFGKPRNVLIEFYAPWCGHCKKLTPVYEKVGKAFADNDSVVIAKMDATANDIPDTTKFKVSGFPTLKFVTADGEIVDYSGDRSEEDLISFVSSHADSAASSAGKAAATGTDEL
jgi:protein disulfide-isomerase A1